MLRLGEILLIPNTSVVSQEIIKIKCVYYKTHCQA